MQDSTALEDAEVAIERVVERTVERAMHRVDALEGPIDSTALDELLAAQIHAEELGQVGTVLVQHIVLVIYQAAAACGARLSVRAILTGNPG